MLPIRSGFSKKTTWLICSFGLISILSSCVKTIEIKGFDKDRWDKALTDCSDYRIEIADHLVTNKSFMLESTQEEIQKLLGQAEEHELYSRNQKFFHYRLSPPDNCGESTNPKYLTIRFNAIGRASEVQVIIR
jgi:hypothetical protein